MNQLREYRQHRLIRLDAYTAILGWITLPLAFLLFTLAKASIIKVHDGIIFATFGAFFFFAIAHFAISFSHKCEACRKHPTIQGLAPVHPYAQHSTGLDGWSRVVWDVFRNRRFRCIHCGEQYITRKSA